MTKSRPVPAAPQLNKKQMRHRKREAEQLRWLWIGIGILVFIIVALLAVGALSSRMRVVARVNGQTIRLPDYEKRARFWFHYYNGLVMPGVFDTIDASQRLEFFQGIAQDMIDETLVRQEAKKLGLTVSNEEIQIALEEKWFDHYRVPPTATPSPTPDLAATPTITPSVPATPTPSPTPDTPETFQANYENFKKVVLQPAGVNESFFRTMIEASLLQDKLKMALVPEVPAEEEQVHLRYTSANTAEAAMARIAVFKSGIEEQAHARHILVKTQEEAQNLIQQLQGGADFAALAAEFSTDDSNKDQGGDLGWFGRGQMVEPFEKAVFENPNGLYATPVETTFGFHVIEILERGEKPINLDEEMYDLGWYGAERLAEQFGDEFAAMVFMAPVGLIESPVPSEYGVAVVEVLAHEMRPLDESAREQLRSQRFQAKLEEIKEGLDIQDLWEENMIPSKM